MDNGACLSSVMKAIDDLETNKNGFCIERHLGFDLDTFYDSSSVNPSTFGIPKSVLCKCIHR